MPNFRISFPPDIFEVHWVRKVFLRKWFCMSLSGVFKFKKKKEEEGKSPETVTL